MLEGVDDRAPVAESHGPSPILGARNLPMSLGLTSAKGGSGRSVCGDHTRRPHLYRPASAGRMVALRARRSRSSREFTTAGPATGTPGRPARGCAYDLPRAVSVGADRHRKYPPCWTDRVGVAMAKMNWDKARRYERARRAERDDPPKRASTAFHLRGSEVCAQCGASMPRGTPARYDKSDRIVHAHGCGGGSAAKKQGGKTTKSRPSGKGGSRKGSKAGSRRRKLSRASQCGTCGVVMAAGSMAVLNKAGQLVHANGCPKKDR